MCVRRSCGPYEQPLRSGRTCTPRTLLSCVGALHCAGHDIAWDALHPDGAGRLVKLPSYPWQTKRYWNETQEATESLFYRPVHPLLGQPVSGVHPTWEAEISVVLNGFLADHRVQGSVVVPGAVYVEMALAAAEESAERLVCMSRAQLRSRTAAFIPSACSGEHSGEG